MRNELTIAVIDDDPAIRGGMSSLIRSVGYQVRLFAGAEQFLRERLTMRIDCAVADIQMPGMNGLQLQQRLRILAPELPMIMMTAFPEDAIRAQALKGGAYAFLSKPFDGATILGCVANAMGGQRQPDD